MSETFAALDAETLMRSWQDAGLVTSEAAPAVAARIRAVHDAEVLPLHVKILSAVGTFFASGFFLGFLGVSQLIDFRSGTAMAVWGGVFLAGAIALALAVRGAGETLGHSVAMQTTFAAMLTGKALVVVGLAMAVQSPWAVTAALAAVAVATYHASDLSLDRLMSPAAVFASLLFDILERGLFGYQLGLVLALYLVVLIGIVAVLLGLGQGGRLYRPIGHAAVLAIGMIVCVLASGHDFGLWTSGRVIDMRPVEVVLTATLIAAIVSAAGGRARVGREPVILAIGGAVLLGVAGAPGLVYALALTVFGHARHDRAMRGLGLVALPIFLVIYYYGRDMTFLVKSATLVASGAALLAARAYMAWRGFDGEDAA